MHPLDTERKLNVHKMLKTYRTSSDVLCTANLRRISRRYVSKLFIHDLLFKQSSEFLIRNQEFWCTVGFWQRVVSRAIFCRYLIFFGWSRFMLNAGTCLCQPKIAYLELFENAIYGKEITTSSFLTMTSMKFYRLTQIVLSKIELSWNLWIRWW